MSDTDSFIEEVSEEVRRDRLFGYFRKYGWIAVMVVVLIVGGAGFNEYRKAQARKAAENTGDAIFAAVEQDENAARIAALSALEVPSADAQMMVELLLASHQIVEGDTEAAIATLDAIANAPGEDIPEIYRQIALFKAVIAMSETAPIAERRTILEALAVPGAPLSLMAQEQLALLDVEEGNSDAAITRLQAIIVDSGVTPGLLRRASQLIVALGGEPQVPTGQAATE